MIVRFLASDVVVDDSDDEFILVGFTDNHRQALHFQRAYELDEQDEALGMAGVYIERNDQSQSGYGGIERVELSRDRVRVLLEERMAAVLDADELEIALSLPSDAFARLREGLRAVFRGFDTLVEHES